MKNKYEEEACDFIGSEECEERLDDRGVNLKDAEANHFGEDLEL
jgi:hypothetical protein